MPDIFDDIADEQAAGTEQRDIFDDIAEGYYDRAAGQPLVITPPAPPQTTAQPQILAQPPIMPGPFPARTGSALDAFAAATRPRPITPREMTISGGHPTPVAPAATFLAPIGEGLGTLAENWHTSPLGELGITPENIPELPVPLPGTDMTIPPRLMTSLVRTGTGFANFLTTPSGIAQTLASLVPGLNVVMAGKFTKDMLEGGWLDLEELGKAINRGDEQGISDHLVGALANFLGAAGAGTHYFKGAGELGAKLDERFEPAPVQGPAAPGSILPIRRGAPVQRVEPPAGVQRVSPEEAEAAAIRMTRTGTSTEGAPIPRPERVTVPESVLGPEQGPPAPTPPREIQTWDDAVAALSARGRGTETRAQIQAMFPQLQLSREVAGDLARDAFGTEWAPGGVKVPDLGVTGKTPAELTGKPETAVTKLELLGRPLEYWEGLNLNTLPKGAERERIAKSLGVVNQPSRILAQVKKRVVEIRANAAKTAQERLGGVETATEEETPAGTPSAEGTTSFQAVRGLSPQQFFTAAQGWTQAAAKDPGVALNPQRQAEAAAAAHPVHEDWRNAAIEAHQEAERIINEIRADPGTLTTRQQELSGAVAKAQFFTEGMQAIEKGITPRGVAIGEAVQKAAVPVQKPEPAVQTAVPAEAVKLVGKATSPWPHALISKDPASGKWRLTWFSEFGGEIEPRGHKDFATREEAVKEAEDLDFESTAKGTTEAGKAVEPSNQLEQAQQDVKDRQTEVQQLEKELEELASSHPGRLRGAKNSQAMDYRQKRDSIQARLDAANTSLRLKQEELSNLSARGKGVAAPPAGKRPILGLKEALDQFDDAGWTVGDLAEHVEALIAEGRAPQELQLAVDTLRAEADKAWEKHPGKELAPEVEQAFLDEVKKAAAEAEPEKPAAKVTPPSAAEEELGKQVEEAKKREAEAEEEARLAPDKKYFEQFKDLERQRRELITIRGQLQASIDDYRGGRYRGGRKISPEQRAKRDLLQKQLDRADSELAAVEKKRHELRMERQVESYDYDTYISQGKELPPDREQNYKPKAAGKLEQFEPKTKSAQQAYEDALNALERAKKRRAPKYKIDQLQKAYEEAAANLPAAKAKAEEEKAKAPEPTGKAEEFLSAGEVEHLAKIMGMTIADWKAQPGYVRNMQGALYRAWKGQLDALPDWIARAKAGDARAEKNIAYHWDRDNVEGSERIFRQAFQQLTGAKNPYSWSKTLMEEADKKAGMAQPAAPAGEKGFPQPNQYGTYDPEAAEKIEWKPKRKTRAAAFIRLLQVGPNRWLVSESLNLGGGPLMGEGHPNRATALANGVARMIANLEDELRRSGVKPTEAKDYKDMIDFFRKQFAEEYPDHVGAMEMHSLKLQEHKQLLRVDSAKRELTDFQRREETGKNPYPYSDPAKVEMSLRGIVQREQKALEDIQDKIEEFSSGEEPPAAPVPKAPEPPTPAPAGEAKEYPPEIKEDPADGHETELFKEKRYGRIIYKSLQDAQRDLDKAIAGEMSPKDIAFYRKDLADLQKQYNKQLKVIAKLQPKGAKPAAPAPAAPAGKAEKLAELRKQLENAEYKRSKMTRDIGARRNLDGIIAGLKYSIEALEKQTGPAPAAAPTKVAPAAGSRNFDAEIAAKEKDVEQLRKVHGAAEAELDKVRAEKTGAPGWNKRYELASRDAKAAKFDLDNAAAELHRLRWEKDIAPYRGQAEPKPTVRITPKVLKGQKEDLLGQVDQAIKEAPDEAKTIGKGDDAKPEKITFNVEGDGQWTIENGKNRLRAFREIVKKEFPTTTRTTTEPGVKSGKQSTSPREVDKTAEDLGKVAGTMVSDDPARRALHHVYSDGTQMVATDGRRLIQIVTDKAPGTLAAPTRLDEKGKELTGDALLDAQSVRFPNYHQVIPSDPILMKGGADSKDLFHIVKQAESFVPDDGKTAPSMDLFLNPDGTFGAKASAPGGEEFSHNLQKGALSMGKYNISYLLDGIETMRRLGGEKFDILAGDETGPIVFRTKDAQYVLMPMRIEGENLSSFRTRPTDFTKFAGKAVSSPLPPTMSPLEHPESLRETVAEKGGYKFRVSLEAGKFELQSVKSGKPIEYGSRKGQRGDDIIEHQGDIPLGDWPDGAKARTALVKPIVQKAFGEHSYVNELTAEVVKKIDELRRERDKLIEEGARRKAISVGPGAASPGDVPAAPPQAVAAGQRTENAPPEERPLGAVAPTSMRLKRLWDTLVATARNAAGVSAPRTTAANRALGEQLVRYASSRQAMVPLAHVFAAQALENTGVDSFKFGTALAEDNLRSIRQSHIARANELRAEGRDLEADQAQAQADEVRSFIGSRRSPFATEEEYQDFLADPQTRRAIRQHIQLWDENIDPQYREAAMLDPDIELPSRGLQTGARVNLKALMPDEVVPTRRTLEGVASPNLTATFRRKTPFAIRAKGTGRGYDTDYVSMIENTYRKQLEIANKNKLDNMLLDTGNAVVAPPGRQIMVGDEQGVGFPIVRKVIVADGRVFSRSANIYVRKSLAGEYREAAAVDPRFEWAGTPILNLLNKAALTGFTDFTVHTSNLMTALFNRPASSNLWADTLLAATGRADIPVTLARAVIKSFQENSEQFAQLSEIGAMRPQRAISWWHPTSKIIQGMDRVTRLVLDDTYQRLREANIVEDSETARREFVNQVGQYNRRLQPMFTRLLRESGFGPFVTAGKTFNALGVRMITLDPGVKGANNFAAAALRANVLSKWVGAFVLTSALNYMITGKVAGRAGTPLGNVDLGTNDKTGKQLSFPLLGLIGLGRGLRVSGVKGVIDTQRLGLTPSDSFDTASRDIINSWIGPAAGPPVKFTTVAASGYAPAVNVPRVSRVVPPGESQRIENVFEALREASPLVKAGLMAHEGKDKWEIMASQFPRISATPGRTEAFVRDYPRIVTMAQAQGFIEDVIGQARRMAFADRQKFVEKQIARMPESVQQHARTEVLRRKVYAR